MVLRRQCKRYLHLHHGRDGIPVPVMNWEATHLSEAWKKFNQHVELIFQGLLKSKSKSYLLFWVGEKEKNVYCTWTGIEDEDAKKLKT